MRPDSTECVFAKKASLGERMVTMNSTLVETVSINYEDFNESFLTCGTCLCMYDGSEHTPKLLQCSHTVCLHCLTRIAASQTRDTGSFRCPICRELITIPRGGVAALPPSFLVNQLLDLMSRQRREVIPKCSVHINQELLFCETCDTVFCTLCTDGSHHTAAVAAAALTASATGSTSASNSCEHTIIPFSIAIKRMSEIVLYKANECISKLTQAQEGVDAELNRLDAAKETCLDQITAIFDRVQSLLDIRKQEMIDALNTTSAEKRKVLEEQHALIESEKNKVEQECQGLQYQVEVRNISQRIESLSEKLDAACSLGEPRENAFLACDFYQNTSLESIEEQLQVLGRVRTSTTFPSLCTARLEDGSANFTSNIRSAIILTTVDYHGNARKTGGDPVQAELSLVGSSAQPHPIVLDVVDCEDGTYKIQFRPLVAGQYTVRITIFERPIKDSVVTFNVTDHNDPVAVYGTKGSGKDEFQQPVAVAIDPLTQLIYVLDTGNSRIKVLNENLEFVKHLTNEGLLGRSCTGIAVSSRGLHVVNWRTKYITEMSTDGSTIRTFTHSAFQEPIDVAIDCNYGHILIADNGVNCVFVFDEQGKILFQVGGGVSGGKSKSTFFNMISAVTVGPAGEIVVADTKIQVFSAKGDFLEVICDEGKAKGRYGGIAVDCENHVLASRTEQKGRSYIQALSLVDHNLNYCIDSHNSKLKRPNGIAITSTNHVVVVDLGNNCIKKYKYC